VSDFGFQFEAVLQIQTINVGSDENCLGINIGAILAAVWTVTIGVADGYAMLVGWQTLLQVEGQVV
jgi:glycerol-3-phosphate dehydrogenase